MVAFHRLSPFTHRHFANKPRLVSGPYGASPTGTSESAEGSSSDSEDGIISKSRNSEYPVYLVIALLSALLTFAICNAVYRTNHILAKRRRYEREKEIRNPVLAQPESSCDKPHFGWNRSCSSSTGYLEPSRPFLMRWWLAGINGFRILSFRKAPVALFKALVTAVYIFLSISFLLVNSKNTKGEYDASYWANRAGALAVAQITFIVALAMKNNIVSVLIGSGFEKLNFLHRIAGRTVCLLIWVHIIGHIIIGLKQDISLEHTFIRAGVLASTALTLTFVIGLRPVRQKFYEFFLATHVVFVLIFILGGIVHVTASTRFLPYLYPALILWAVDRALRLFRIIINRSQSRKARVTISLNDSEFSATMTHRSQIASPTFIIPFADGAVGVFIQLPSDISNKTQWHAGQLALLSIPAASRYGFSFESHPFSIASIDTPLETFLSGELKNGNGNLKWLRQSQGYDVRHSGDGVFERSSSGSQYSFEELKLKSDSGSEKRLRQPTLTEMTSSTNIFMRFIIHPRAGFTLRLRKLAEDVGSGASVSAFVDGPYGSPPDVSAYEKVVLVAGGSGITFTFPLLLDLVRRARSARSTTVCRHVTLIWTVRDPRQVDWIENELALLQNSPLSLIVKIHLHCTRDIWSIHELHASHTQQPQATSSFDTNNFQPPSRAFAAPPPVDPYTPYEVQPRTVPPQRPARSVPPLSSLLEDIPISPMEYTGSANARGMSGSDSSFGYGSGRPRIGSAGGRERPAHVQRFTGRPSFEQVFRGRGSPLRDGGDVAVCVAGPRAMVDDVRHTLGSWDLAGPGRVSRGGANVFLHIESYEY